MKSYECSYCGKDTSAVDYDYLSGTDHLSCVLEAEMKAKGQYDTCIICGVETPYKRNVHVDLRVGYIEGAGQLCKNCYDKGTNRRHFTVPEWLVERYPNDQELGGKVRELYYDNKDNS